MTAPVLTIEKLHKSFRDVGVLKGVNLEIEPGEVVSIIGSSGSGKTTLLRCINLLEEFEAGHVRIDGEEIGYRESRGRRVKLPSAAVARQRAMTGMVFQSFNLFPHLTALRNVTLGLRKVRRLGKDEAVAIAEHWLDRVGLKDRRDHYPGQLSGGQQQRGAIARAVAMAPKLLLLDEITSALDPELVNEVLNVVRGLADDGMTMLIVTHEMRFARDVSSRVIFMNAGQIAEAGTPAQIFREPRSPRLREFLRTVSV
jgi:polar amino acid transport system ATP-binding protein